MAIHGHAPIRNPQLVHATAIPQSAVSKIVHLLANQGLATIEPDPRNHRRRLYRLTDLGHSCAIAGPPSTPTTPAIQQPPHHGPCPPGRDCDVRLARPATQAILTAIDRVTAPCITPHALTQDGRTSQTRASAILEAFARDGYLAQTDTSNTSSTRVYRLTPLGQGCLDDAIHRLHHGQQPGMNTLNSTEINNLIEAFSEWLTNPATTTTIQQLTRSSHSTVTNTLQLLIHRGLITSETTQRNRLQRVRPTSTGQSWLARHATSDTRDDNARRVEAPQRDRVAAAIMADLSASPPAWPAEIPSARELACRYRTSDSTVRDAEKLLAHHGLLVHHDGRDSAQSSFAFSSAPLPTWFRHVRSLIAFGPPTIPITSAEIADQHDADHNGILDTILVFAELGAVTRTDHPTLGIPRWSRSPAWAMPASGVAFRTMVTELARRIDTGWYRWTGLDGATYQRPFPTLHELTQQFHTSQHAACQAIGILHQLTYLRAAAIIPPNLDSVTGRQLLARHQDASLVIDAQQLTCALDAMPDRWIYYGQLSEVSPPRGNGSRGEQVKDDVEGRDPWAS